MTGPRVRMRDERGWAVLTTILVIGILMSISLPLLSMVDTQQAGSAHERKSEGVFNVSEAALSAMVFKLSSSWPASDGSAYPASCTEASTELTCPDVGAIKRTYQGGDFPTVSWTVKVRDDASGDYYDAQALEQNPATWDRNRNGKLWVRAEGRGPHRPRTIVALTRVHEQLETFPRHVLTAGWFATSNQGNKVIVDTRGTSAEAATLAVRCTETGSQSCLGYDSGKRQVEPERVQVGFTGPTAVAADALDGFREKAKSLNSYYDAQRGCPQSLGGELVFIEQGDCSYSGGGTWNSSSAPGMVVIATGTLHLSGSPDYYGMIYAANLQESSGAVVTLTANAKVVGSIAVDGAGGVIVGSTGGNITFAERVLPEIRSHRAVGIVQGSWRELSGS